MNNCNWCNKFHEDPEEGYYYAQAYATTEDGCFNHCVLLKKRDLNDKKNNILTLNSPRVMRFN